MPYDIAASLGTPSKFRALQLANRRLEQEGRLLKQSADHYEATGTSEASQKDVQLGIDNQNMLARWGELSRNIDEDSRRAADTFFDQIAAVQRYMDLNPDDKEGAQQLYENARDANLIPKEGHALSTFNPRMVKAIAEMKATTDPEIPWNWYNTNTGERGSVEAHDAAGFKKLVGPDVLFGRGDLGTGIEGGIGKTELVDLRNAEVHTRGFLATAADGIKLAQNAPNMLTFVARSASWLNSLKQEAIAAADELGVQGATELLNPDTYADTFETLGINERRMKGLITSLAFQAALAQKSSGRDVSNADVDRFIQEVGAKTSDPESFVLTLMDVARRADRQYRINHKVRTKQEYGDDLGLGALEELVGEVSTEPQDNGLAALEELYRTNKDTMSIEDLQKLLELRRAR